jgi:hypothetical protein
MIETHDYRDEAYSSLSILKAHYDNIQTIKELNEYVSDKVKSFKSFTIGNYFKNYLTPHTDIIN